MSCPRDAAFNAVHDYPGGAAALAPRLGKNATTLCHELTGQGTAKLGLLDAVKISKLTGSLAIVQAMCGELGGVFVPLVGSNDAAGVKGLGVAVREFGEMVGQYAEAIADGRVSANELQSIDREGLQAIASIVDLLNQARASHEACTQR